MSQRKISVVGLGYIGLPTAAYFASQGYEVLGTDIQEYIVDAVNSGKSHIVEPGLQEIVSEVVAGKLLRAYSDVQPADVYMICVPTPFLRILDYRLRT